MHVPNPLGGLPLVLRDSEVENPRKGELLLNYTTLDLITVNKKTGNKVRLADSIYQQIIATRLENSKIEITHTDTVEGAEEKTLPDVSDRKMNTWYMNITKRTVNVSESSDEG